MKVPNHENAFVPPDKLSGYLLNHNHPDGSGKAQFFEQLGFEPNSLETTLITHIVKYDFAEKTVTNFGTKYVILGLVESPLGIQFNLKSIWITLNEETEPKLKTAYPSKK